VPVNDAVLSVLEAVRLEHVNGRSGTADAIARTLRTHDRSSLTASLDGLVASGHLERDEVDHWSMDADWPAAPLDAYVLTSAGHTVLAGLSGDAIMPSPPFPALREGSLGQRMLAEVVELGMQAYEKTGDIREAITEAAINAWYQGHVEGEDGCDGCSFRTDLAAGGRKGWQRAAAG
jgi:hypothetical protein